MMETIKVDALEYRRVMDENTRLKMESVANSAITDALISQLEEMQDED